MGRVLSFVVALFAVAALVGSAAAQQDQTAGCAVGVVYNDTNLNGVRDAGEKGIAGVRVSNGRTSTKTDEAGGYRLPVDDDTIVFVVKPRNWRTQVDPNGVPRFYYIHKPNGSPKLQYKGVDPTGPLPASVDFPMYSHPEPDRFRVLFLGDSQVGSVQEIGCFAHDIVEELVGTDVAFGVSLGDIVDNDLSLYEPLLPVMGKIGVPCYYVKGNHDSNYDGGCGQKAVDETFNRAFGPSWYSFDYGPVHFVAINDPYFTRPGHYEAQLELEQMAFLRDDLASIPKDQLVVLMMHIPIIELNDRNEIYKLLESHPNVFAIGAHWHTQKHYLLTQNDGWNGAKPLHLLINVTTCGSWWEGALDEVGLPHTTMRDGAPNGYSIATFDGNSYSIRYKAARRPDDYQMNIYAPDVVKSGKTGSTEVLVNVFAGSERSKVEMSLGDSGVWKAMEPTDAADPAFSATKKREDGVKPPLGASLPGADKNTGHIWKANLPSDTAAGTYLVHVRTTDMFGQTYVGSRVLVVE